MPVRYEAPGPVSFGNLYGRNRGGGGGGGGGGGVEILHDDTARQQNQLAAIGLQNQAESQQIAQRGLIQAGLQVQAADLDAWQFQQKVTEQEAMQLRQDQNAIAAIDADPTMSEMEKMQAKTQVRTRIDFVSQRQKRDMQQAHLEMEQARARDIQQQTALRDNALTFQQAEIGGKLGHWVPPKFRNEVTRLMSVAYPDIPPGHPQYETISTTLADELGFAERFTKNAKGEMVFEKDVKGQGKDGKSSKGDTSEDDARNEVLKINQAVDAWAAKEMTPPSEEARTAKKDALKKEIDEAVAKQRANTPAGKQKAAEEKHVQALAGMDAEMKTIAAMPFLSSDEKAAAGGLLQRMKELATTFPPGMRPAKVQQELDKLDKHYEEIRALGTERAPRMMKAFSGE